MTENTPAPAPAPAPAPEPILYFEGQPTTREQAAATRASLMANEEFSKKALAGDREAQQKLTELWQLERGWQPTTPATVKDVEVQIRDRAAEDRHRVIETWAKHIRLTEQGRFELARGLATAEQVENAKAELDKMKRDPAFGRRVTAGDRDAVDQWSRMNLVAAMRVAPPDYKWDAMPSPVRK
jgi:hypothetical protein